MDQQDSTARDRGQRHDAREVVRPPAQRVQEGSGGVPAHTAAAAPVDGVRVVRVARDDDRFEVWTRVTDDAPRRGVSAIRLIADAGTWEVAVDAARLAPAPLEPALQAAITDSLLAIPAVFDAFHEDGGIWMVHGEASGEALIRACAGVIDSVADRLGDDPVDGTPHR